MVRECGKLYSVVKKAMGEEVLGRKWNIGQNIYRHQCSGSLHNRPPTHVLKPPKVSANLVLWSMLGILLVATVFVRNLYCRFLCPVGATLGIISLATVFGIKRWSECKSCRICEKTCEWGAIEGPKIIKTECVRCDDCERVYADQAKCPHWLIPIVRQKKIAEARAAGKPVPQFIPLEKV